MCPIYLGDTRVLTCGTGARATIKVTREMDCVIARRLAGNPRPPGRRVMPSDAKKESRSGRPPRIQIGLSLSLHRSVVVPIELPVQAGRNRLHLRVMVHDVDRKCLRRGAVEVVAPQIYEAIFETQAKVARELVFETAAHSPAVAPVVNREAVWQGGIAPRYIDLRSGIAAFGIDEPFVGRHAHATGDREDCVNVRAVSDRWINAAPEIVAQRRATQRRFDAEHDVAELLVVADLATTDETGGIVVDPFARQINVAPVNVLPVSSHVTADVKACPAHEWSVGTAWRVPVSHCGGCTGATCNDKGRAQNAEPNLHRWSILLFALERVTDRYPFRPVLDTKETRARGMEAALLLVTDKR